MWPVYAKVIEAALGAQVDEEIRAALAGLLAALAAPVDASRHDPWVRRSPASPLDTPFPARKGLHIVCS
jgi:hypothetical protein